MMSGLQTYDEMSKYFTYQYVPYFNGRYSKNYSKELSFFECKQFLNI